jgi:cation diffusion facilitator CzcD-associated flavoprotein CzcO
VSEPIDRGDTVCIIGAGSSGLAGAHRLLERGWPVEVIERTDHVGGNWKFGSPASRVFATTHLVSSKRMTEYPDYPMPERYPDFPSHVEAQDYIEAYARHFRLLEHIRFGTCVEQVRKAPDGRGWHVLLSDGNWHRYRALVVANGHNWLPRWPEYPGEFAGTLIHAADYRDAEVLRGKRVVVVGGGNSGCDIACDAAAVASTAVHSLRRGYHIMPKYVFGKPTDLWAETFVRARVPLAARRAVGNLLLKMFSHELWRYGYPKPDHRIWETHLVLNSQIAHHASHGRITAKPDIARFEGSDVVFRDGTRTAADVVVLATGYLTTLPFLGEQDVDWRDGVPALYLNLFSPKHDDLFVLGLMQPSQGQWQLVDHQARAVAAYLGAAQHEPRRAERFRELVRGPAPHLGGSVRYVDSPRHAIELDHASYRRRMEQVIRQLGGQRRRVTSDGLPRQRSQTDTAGIR